MTALTELYLRGNEIADVSPLAGMTALTELYLRGNEIADVSPLAGLTALAALYLGNNAIADVSPLAHMAALTELNLESNQVIDVSPLAGLTALTDLHLGYNEISDVSPLADLTSLTYLDLAGNAISDVSPLAGLTSLTYLDLAGDAILSDNEVVDITPLAGLTSLTYLNLAGNAIPSGNEVVDITPLAGLTSLVKLNLSFNWRIADIRPLAGLTSLQELHLERNQIADVSPLAGLTSLTWLELRANSIVDVGPLGGLTSLTRLSLAANSVKNIGPLASLTSLRSIVLYSVGTWDVSPLAGLTSLEAIYLGQNEIYDISPLGGLTSLKVLALSGNRIMDLSSVVNNVGVDQGDRLFVDGNPLSQRSREMHIPALRQRGVEVVFDELLEIPDLGLREAAERAVYALGVELATVRVLDASYRDVETLEGIEGAPDLGQLLLDGNSISDITPLAHLGGLFALTLSRNTVEDWVPLAGMNSLVLLALDWTSIGDLPQLPLGLRYLYLADNSISGIARLADMWGLVELDVSGNAITSLEPLAGQGELRYLHVHDNQVTDISPLNFAPLRELHMANNAVRDISPLLDGEELLMADVRGNPLGDGALRVLEALRERRVTVLAGETVPYFPAAGEGRQGFVRVVNHGDEAGHAFIEAVDDAGVRAGPVRLELGARQAVHFNSADLEYGSAAKGLAGIGAPTAGDWRLSVISALDVEVLSYIRTGDGFVTAMHDVAPDAMAPFFNPGSNRNQRSILRVVNTEAEPAKWTTGGYDDRGNWHPMTGSLLVRPQHALTLAAQELEDAHGLGDGSGKWRLRVRGFPWFAMSLLESPTGHLTNLSTAPAHTTVLEDGVTMHRLPLFPAAGGARQGFARLINRSYSSGEVTIWAVDDAGKRSGPVRLTMRPRRVVHFNSADLEGGNAAKGLEGSVGLGEGDWRLEITSELHLMALAYARTTDGFLTSLHDLAPMAADGSHRVVFFNPGSNTRQVSKLRLINDGERSARVTITGIDDWGNASGRVVRTVPAGSALTFTAAELEAGGERVAGSLGDGEGKWRLRVRSDGPIAVMSLLALPTGHLTNLSTAPPRDGPTSSESPSLADHLPTG